VGGTLVSDRLAGSNPPASEYVKNATKPGRASATTLRMSSLPMNWKTQAFSCADSRAKGDVNGPVAVPFTPSAMLLRIAARIAAKLCGYAAAPSMVAISAVVTPCWIEYSSRPGTTNASNAL